MNRIGVALLFGSLALGPAYGSASEHLDSLEQIVVEMAQTPEHHQALARHYRAKAEEARAEMGRHERMGNSYTGGKIAHRQRMKRHCESIAARYAGLAADYEALAELHEEEVKAKPSR